jgi:hypothetical protein
VTEIKDEEDQQMAHKRKTQPDKPAPFVPKTTAEIITSRPTGRPSQYDPKATPKLVRGMAKQGLSEGMMARILEISPSTFSLWKTQHSAFSKALEYGREACNGALEATAVQRALGYSYETEKAFQTGIRMTVTETMPPDPNLLKFLLERRIPERYREIKEVQHTHNAGALFQEFLKRMDAKAKEHKLLEAVSLPLAQTEQLVDIVEVTTDQAQRSSE